MASVEKIAEVVLYEGYLLFPYRRSSMKNQQRWTFGGVYPRAYSEANGGDDPWTMQTQCLVVGDRNTTVEVRVRFLHVVDRRVARMIAENGAPAEERFVEELRGEDQVYQPGEEAIEREVPSASPSLRDLMVRGRRLAIDIPEGSAFEPVLDRAGTMAGKLIRSWRTLQGMVEIAAEPIGLEPSCPKGKDTCYRLTVRIANTTPWTPPAPERDERGHTWSPGERPRDAALRQTFVSTHTILRVRGGTFVSLLEPPDGYQAAAAGCVNSGTWPVLVGEQGERHTLLSSPIILYDYPQIAPESPGDLFETTEIDELLTLSILALTDEEKEEMRESDARARAILERTESLSHEQMMKLHGAIRGLQPARPELDAPSLTLKGHGRVMSGLSLKAHGRVTAPEGADD